jgi:hypothetical protein
MRHREKHVHIFEAKLIDEIGYRDAPDTNHEWHRDPLLGG